MTEQPPDADGQRKRDRFAAAIDSTDISLAKQLLEREPWLVNADLRPVGDRDRFTNGLALFRACEKNADSMVELLLQHGAHPDAPANNPDDQPELGIPLHLAAAEHRNYRLANVLLDCGASPNSYPYCDQATIERMFYLAREAAMTDSIVRRSYARYLPDREKLEAKTVTELVGTEAPEAVKLYARMVDLGAQPPFSAIVRDGFHDLAIEIVDHCPHASGPPHDHPNSTVVNNMFGEARWHGYYELVRRLMNHSSYQYSYESAIETIGVAIGSHNRDCDYPEYRQMIVDQLIEIQSNGDLEKAQGDAQFKPLYRIATDFIWHSNYGFRAAIAKPECYIDLAELFVSWGFDDINFRDPKSRHSPLSAAIERGQHPGITTYIRWLLDQGAEVRESAPDEVNPIAIAHSNGYAEIVQLLENRE